MNLQGIDTALFFSINQGMRNGFFDIIMPFVTEWSKFIFLPLLLWCFLKEGNRAWKFLAIAALSIALADGSGNVLKNLIGRVRPCTVLENVHLLMGCGSSFSMPSNHASNVFAVAMVFWLLRRSLVSGLYVFIAGLIAFSRVYIGVHYPFDVAAGALLGCAAASGSIALYRWSSRIYEKRAYEEALYLAVLLFSLFRIYYILTGPFDLSFDEAHYWEWSRRLDLSYYSKGPMIAYLIHAGTLIFGDTVFGVRIFAVIFSALSSIVIYRLGRELYDERTGLASALLIQIVPLYSVYGLIFTIDSPFIFFWTLALFLFWKAINDHLSQGPKRTGFLPWVLLGITVGMGLLTKYTMAFFYLSSLLFLISRKETRGLLASRGPYVSFACSMIVFSPVIAWNAVHGWVTLKHTAGQAHLYDGLALSAKNFFEFLGSQLGVITPVLFILMIIALWRSRRDKNGAFLFWFSVPVILFFVLKSIQGKVQANWALPGYAAGFVAFAAYYVRGVESLKKPSQTLVASAFVLAFAVTAVAHFPNVLHLPEAKDPSRRLLGWRELGREAGKIYDEFSSAGPVFVFSDSYQVSSELAFYMIGHPVTYCANSGRRMNQYDLWPGFGKLIGSNALFVTAGDENMSEDLSKAFGRYEKKTVDLQTNRGRRMKFTFFKCYDFKGIESRQVETY
jgi:4-amino-4-deoxy-L-arabinose transferase-like glycosyltransferase/membrane-associated phospholipid phosphatase